MDNAANQKKIVVIYDMNAEQRIPLSDGIIAVMSPYTEELYKSDREGFTKALNQLLKKKGGSDIEAEEIETKAAIEQESESSKRLIVNLENYPDLPSTWRDDLSVEDARELFNRAYNFVIDEDAKKFSLGGITVPTAAYFNGVVCQQSHKLRKKTINDSSRYALIKSREYKTEPAKRLGQEPALEYVPQDAAKIALYDEMKESVTGFADDAVPSRVKILVIDYVFKPAVEQKK